MHYARSGDLRIAYRQFGEGDLDLLISPGFGARIAALAGAGEVWASRTVRDLTAGSDLAFADRGSHPLKGVPGEWELYALVAT